MAKKLKDFTFPQDDDKRTLPLDFWFDGGVWEIPLDDTNYANFNNLRAALWGYAKRRNLKLRTVINKEKDVLVIQTFREDA